LKPPVAGGSTPRSGNGTGCQRSFEARVARLNSGADATVGAEGSSPDKG